MFPIRMIAYGFDITDQTKNGAGPNVIVPSVTFDASGADDYLLVFRSWFEVSPTGNGQLSYQVDSDGWVLIAEYSLNGNFANTLDINRIIPFGELSSGTHTITFGVGRVGGNDVFVRGANIETEASIWLV